MRIAIVDTVTAVALPRIAAMLGLAFEQYRNELPARAAEKLKKEKLAAKKQSKAASKSAKSTTVESKAKPNPDTIAAAPASFRKRISKGFFAS